MYRQFTIKDAEDKVIKFKVWPKLAPPNKNKIVYDKMEIELKVETNKAMMDLVGVCAEFMDENTINKVTIEEFDDGG